MRFVSRKRLPADKFLRISFSVHDRFVESKLEDWVSNQEIRGTRTFFKRALKIIPRGLRQPVRHSEVPFVQLDSRVVP